MKLQEKVIQAKIESGLMSNHISQKTKINEGTLVRIFKGKDCKVSTLQKLWDFFGL